MRPNAVERGLHDGGATLGGGDRVGVEDGLATGGLDLVDDLLAGSGVAAGAVDRTAHVVDDHERTPAGEQQRVLPPEAAARTGDDRHLAVETEIHHRHSSPQEADSGADIRQIVGRRNEQSPGAAAPAVATPGGRPSTAGAVEFTKLTRDMRSCS